MKRAYGLLGWAFLSLTIWGCGDSHHSGKKTPQLVAGDVVSMTLIQTTDVHHRGTGTGPSLTYSPADGIDNSGPGGSDQTRGGYARLSTKIAQVRQEAEARGEPSLLVDSGDFIMGTVYDLTLGSMPAGFYFLELLNYDVVTIGNHEFDYGPAGLAGIFNNALGPDMSGFTVPVVATNMRVDGIAGTDDDGLEALVDRDIIQGMMVKTLANGLKVGIIGLLGTKADADAPLTPPLVFDHDYAFIQSQVDYLRNEMGAHIVVALSHSGITDTDTIPAGDDVLLARNVTGIDIIASGHEHEMTPAVVVENNTRIFCAGAYGTNLAQMDLTVEVGAGVTAAVLTNHPINDSVPGDPLMILVMETIEAGINDILTQELGLEINTVLAVAGSDNLGQPSGAQETGLGNLVADSLRYMLQGTPGAIGIAANGVIRDGFALDQQVTFADMYSVLPLGMTIDPVQQDVPGYPLMQVFLSGAHLKNMCQLNAYVAASRDDDFMAFLAASPDPAAQALAFGLSNLSPNYFLNVSGIRYTHFDATGMYQVVPGSVEIYDGPDFSCQLPAVDIDDDTLYPCVFDIYLFMIFQSDDLQTLLAGLGLPITPVNALGEVVNLANMLDYRLDQDAAVDGIQEVKEWMAFLTFLSADAGAGGFADHLIPDAAYGTDALAAGDASRVTMTVMPQ
jgi:5'-nucleotidase